MGVASFILGIISVVLALIILITKVSFGIIPTLCAIVAIVLGFIQNKQEKDSKATAGIIMGFIYFAILIIVGIQAAMVVRSILS